MSSLHMFDITFRCKIGEHLHHMLCSVSTYLPDLIVSYVLEESPIHNYFCENLLYHSVKDSSSASWQWAIDHMNKFVSTALKL
jgi:hypothetical protein